VVPLCLCWCDARVIGRALPQRGVLFYFAIPFFLLCSPATVDGARSFFFLRGSLVGWLLSFVFSWLPPDRAVSAFATYNSFEYTIFAVPSNFSIAVGIYSTDSDSFTVTFGNPVCDGSGQDCISTCSVGGAACKFQSGLATLQQPGNPFTVSLECTNFIEHCDMSTYLQLQPAVN
jgi:hypothetical protein